MFQWPLISHFLSPNCQFVPLTCKIIDPFVLFSDFNRLANLTNPEALIRPRFFDLMPSLEINASSLEIFESKMDQFKC
jgi:hypothetical protein